MSDMKDYKHIEHMRNLNDSLIWERMKRCYDYGYEDGQKEKLANAVIHDHEVAEKTAYEQGLDEAWEVARKLVHPRLGGYTEEQKQRIFGEYVSSDSILQNFSASEAITKIKEYEDKQKQAEIKVGDEVYSDDFDDNGIVSHITEDGNCVAIISSGSSMMKVNIHNVHKTGRHFPQIAEVLKQMNPVRTERRR